MLRFQTEGWSQTPAGRTSAATAPAPSPSHHHVKAGPSCLCEPRCLKTPSRAAARLGNQSAALTMRARGDPAPCSVAKSHDLVWARPRNSLVWLHSRPFVTLEAGGGGGEPAKVSGTKKEQREQGFAGRETPLPCGPGLAGSWWRSGCKQTPQAGESSRAGSGQPHGGGQGAAGHWGQQEGEKWG